VRFAALVLFAALFLIAAPLARADGDPASDVLITQDVFLPYGEGIPIKAGEALTATVAEANKAGFRIKVAVIASRTDLGLIQSLWRKPTLYAPFLGRELLFIYRQTLVIVMPNGFGVFRNNENVSRETAVLARVPIGAGSAGLAAAMTEGVRKLSAAAGHPLAASGGGSGGSGWLDRVLIGVGAAILLAVLAVLGQTFRRRRSAQLGAKE
jgi:hypothetical protein